MGFIPPLPPSKVIEGALWVQWGSQADKREWKSVRDKENALSPRLDKSCWHEKNLGKKCYNKRIFLVFEIYASIRYMFIYIYILFMCLYVCVYFCKCVCAHTHIWIIINYYEDCQYHQPSYFWYSSWQVGALVRINDSIKQDTISVGIFHLHQHSAVLSIKTCLLLLLFIVLLSLL